MADDLNAAAAATKTLAIDAVTATRSAVAAEAITIWQKLVGLFNRFWPIAAAAAGGYVLGATHALGVF